MTKEQWRWLQVAAGALAVACIIWLFVGATLPVFITVGVVLLACGGVVKIAGDKYSEILADELHKE